MRVVNLFLLFSCPITFQTGSEKKSHTALPQFIPVTLLGLWLKSLTILNIHLLSSYSYLCPLTFLLTSWQLFSLPELLPNGLL